MYALHKYQLPSPAIIDLFKCKQKSLSSEMYLNYQKSKVLISSHKSYFTRLDYYC